MKIRNGAGFSMVELLVAITIIAIMVLPLVGLISSQLRKDQRTVDRKIALQLAQSTMEKLLDRNFPGSQVRDDSSAILLNGKQWIVLVDALDGLEYDEPDGGTDPLEVHVTVYAQEDRNAKAAFKALKGP